MAYPFVAFVAGWIYEHTSARFVWAAVASVAAEVLLFASGLGWLAVLTHSVSMAIGMASTGSFLRKSSRY